MKSRIIVSIAILVIGSAALFAFVSHNKTRETPPPLREQLSLDYSATLRNAGFTNVVSLTKAESAREAEVYNKKYGVPYISDAEMSTMMKETGFVIGDASVYNGEIPTDQATRMAEKFTKISAAEPLLNSLNQRDNRWYTLKDNPDGYKATAIMLMAPAEMFNDSYVIGHFALAKSKDPVALYRVKDGWLELARW